MTQLALVIDLNVCVGCQRLRDLLQGVEHLRCAPDRWPTRIPMARSPPGPSSTASRPTRSATIPNTETVHFPKSCLHCEDPPCVPVCPTGASYKRKEDGIVLVDYDKCIGCKYCSWACPYGARELDEQQQVMKKCTLCVDRIYDMTMAEADRKPSCVMACPTSARLFGDIQDPGSRGLAAPSAKAAAIQLMPEWGTHPANHYLPRRKTRVQDPRGRTRARRQPAQGRSPAAQAGQERADAGRRHAHGDRRTHMHPGLLRHLPDHPDRRCPGAVPRLVHRARSYAAVRAAAAAGRAGASTARAACWRWCCWSAGWWLPSSTSGVPSAPGVPRPSGAPPGCRAR